MRQHLLPSLLGIERRVELRKGSGMSNCSLHIHIRSLPASLHPRHPFLAFKTIIFFCPSTPQKTGRD
jgi:hypothetical protein